MDTARLVSLLAAWGTWATLAYTMKSYFRFARQRTPAKTFLVVCAFVCTLTQLATLALAPQAGAAWLWSGVAGFALAQGLFWWALAAHGKSHPAFAFIQVDPATLTTAGPYRLIRHPIYTAYLVAWCAGVAVTGQPWLLVTVLCMAPFYLLAARQEEKSFRAGALAPQYEEYQARTGMFVPKVSSLWAGRKAA
jgi:protein-S-isoprenylcysteine O-methyltransferase Ste14